MMGVVTRQPWVREAIDRQKSGHTRRMYARAWTGFLFSPQTAIATGRRWRQEGRFGPEYCFGPYVVLEGSTEQRGKGMAKDKEHEGKFELSRRDFLKAGAAAAVVGATGADMVVTASRAVAADVAATYTSTCPYCSAQCGQLVDVDASGNVLDIYGDFNSPTSRGGLCAKGAGAYQLVTNSRRLGVPAHTAAVDGYDFTGTAWKRVGNGTWDPIAVDTAWAEVAAKLVEIRDVNGTQPVVPGVNKKSVQFFGCSHMNNEQNNLYRKVIANFGTSLVEHQARI